MSDVEEQPPTDEVKPAPRVETWVYGGERVASKGKRGYAWVDEDGSGEQLIYAKFKGGIVGGRYSVSVSRIGDRISVHDPNPEYLGVHDDTELRTRLEVRHMSARSELANAARQRNDSRRKALDEVVQPLVDLASTCSPMEREALLAHILRRITAAW